MAIETKVRIELTGWAAYSDEELSELMAKHASNGEPDANDLKVDVSHSLSRPSVVTFTTPKNGVDWSQWLTSLVDAALEYTGVTCQAKLTATTIETTQIDVQAEAANLTEYVVAVPVLRTVRKRVAAKDAADAIARVNAGEGILLHDDEGAPADPSNWSVTLFYPQPPQHEELPEAA